MTEYNLNQLTRRELADLALNSATFLAEVTRLSVKLELYYFEGHFIEAIYCKKMPSNEAHHWRMNTINHFPDIPENTHYLTIYLKQIQLPVGEGQN